MLRFRFLGQPKGSCEGHGFELSSVGAALPLLAYLLLVGREPRLRERIAADLWPDATSEDAAKRLRRQLHRLNRALPPSRADAPWILADRRTLQWNPSSAYRLDVEDFDRLCAEVGDDEIDAGRSRDNLEEAVRLYAGDLLTGIDHDLPDGAWVDAERERLRNAYGHVLDRLAAEQALAGDVAAAAGTARLLTDYDAFREKAHRLRIGLEYLDGNRAAAIEAYEACRTVLRSTLDVEPMPQTERLAEAVRASAPVAEVGRLLQADVPGLLRAIGHLPGQLPHNLPSQLTSLIGRERELTSCVNLLRMTQLLTLVGPGGCGKTRLALTLAELVVASGGELPTRDDGGDRGGERRANGVTKFDEGVWWVDLSSVDEPELLAPTVLSTLGIQAEPGRQPLDVLVEHVRNSARLLVLDNCEHLLEAAARLVEPLLGAALPRIVATSREPLGLEGELPLPVSTLSVPADSSRLAPQELLGYDAPLLFVERAREAQRSFELRPDNATAVADICQLLDGVPLAVELAACRVGVLTPTEIAARLSEPFKLLIRAPRTEQARHGTLQEAIEWSHRLLSEPERRLLRRLSVFRGGFTGKAAAAVCAIDPAAGEIADPETLAGKSLLTRTGDRAKRYRMLHTVRQYAADRLDAAGETSATRGRHLAHYLAMARLAEPELRGPEQAAWLERLALERDNIRAALAWGIGTGGDAAVQALELATAMRWHWYFRNELAEGQHWLQRALGAAGAASAADRAWAHNAAGVLAQREGDLAAARSHFEDSLALLEATDDEHGQALLLGNLGLVAGLEGNHEAARGLYLSSLHLLEAQGDALGTANALGNLGRVAYSLGDMKGARAYYERNLQLRREMASPWDLAMALRFAADVDTWEGEYDAASRRYREALRLFGEVGDSGATADTLTAMGSSATWQGRYGDARRYLTESLELYRELGLESGVGAALGSLGQLARLEGDAEAAIPSLLDSLATYWALGHRDLVVSVLGMLGEAEGQLGRLERAATLWGAAEALAEATGMATLPAGRADYERNVAEARARADAAAFDRAWAAGRLMSLEEAVGLALAPARCGDSETESAAGPHAGAADRDA